MCTVENAFEGLVKYKKKKKHVGELFEMYHVGQREGYRNIMEKKVLKQKN